jgi:hypothetical protein
MPTISANRRIGVLAMPLAIASFTLACFVTKTPPHEAKRARGKPQEQIPPRKRGPESAGLVVAAREMEPVGGEVDPLAATFEEDLAANLDWASGTMSFQCTRWMFHVSL